MTLREMELLDKNPLEIPHSMEQGAVYASLILMRQVTVDEFKEYIHGDIQQPKESET